LRSQSSQPYPSLEESGPVLISKKKKAAESVNILFTILAFKFTISREELREMDVLEAVLPLMHPTCKYKMNAAMVVANIAGKHTDYFLKLQLWLLNQVVNI
jgi:hypothetical protein